MKICLPRFLELEILLHYYVSGVEFSRLNAPACKEAMAWLLTHELLELNSKLGPSVVYAITERGREHLKSLLCVPLPHKTWETDWNSI